MDIASMMRASVTPSEQALIMARRAEERDALRAERDEAERLAQQADERENRLIAAARTGLAGRSFADMTADASRAADEDDQYQEALKVIARTDKRRAARQEALRYEAEQLESLTRARNGHPEPDGIAHANRLARARVEQLLTSPAKPRRRRPFAIRSGSEPDHQCVFCTVQDLNPDTGYLLHSDPETRVPITTAEQASPEDLAWLREEAGRSRTRSPEITR